MLGSLLARGLFGVMGLDWGHRNSLGTWDWLGNLRSVLAQGLGVVLWTGGQFKDTWVLPKGSGTRGWFGDMGVIHPSAQGLKITVGTLKVVLPRCLGLGHWGLVPVQGLGISLGTQMEFLLAPSQRSGVGMWGQFGYMGSVLFGVYGQVQGLESGLGTPGQSQFMIWGLV